LPRLPAGVGERADQFLLLGVDADHGIGAGLMVFNLLIEVAKLPVTVRVLPALDGFGVGLQAESVLP
jgi:hypothetical protein